MLAQHRYGVGSTAAAALVLGGIGLFAIFFGLLAATASPILIGLAVALLLGAMLLAHPIWIIWLILFLGMLVAGVVPIWAEGAASKAVWGISLLGFLLMFRAWLNAMTTAGTTRNTPAFVWAALVFLIYAIVSTLLNWPSAYEALSGFKRYFQAMGLLFSLAWLPIGERDIARWRKFFLIVAVVQLPWAVYELVKLVPIREGLRYAYPGLVPIDVVAGTFGANITQGGANAEMATFLIIVLGFMLARLREKVFTLPKLLLLAPLVLTPLFLGETKAVVVMLPLLFLTLYRRELLARPHLAFMGLLLGVGLTIAAGYAYLTITQKTFDQQMAETLRYNVQDKGYGGYVLNRTTVLSFWAQRQGLHDPAGAVLGHGLGTAHDATGGEIARRYPGYGIGLTAASILLWEQGILGSVLFLAMLALAWKAANGLRRAQTPAWARADAAALQAALPLFAFYLIYRSALLEVLPFQIVFYTLLGYLAWLVRRFAGGQAA